MSSAALTPSSPSSAAAAHEARVIAAGSARRSLIRLIGSCSAKNSAASPESSSCS
jgi:hypothetical protein